MQLGGAALWLFPVDVNRAPFEMLLRVPGIGPRAPGASGAPASRRRWGWTS